MADEDVIGMVVASCKDDMRKAVTHTQNEFAAVRTGRASPALVERLRVDYYGGEVPLQQIAGLSVPEARLLVLSPYDKSAIPAIEKAIQNSDLGINPSNDGNVIRLTFPQLTEDRRKDLVKVVKHKAEEGRVAIRNARRHSRHELDSFEKAGDLSSDEVKRGEEELDSVTKTFVAEIDKLLANKEQELLEV